MKTRIVWMYLPLLVAFIFLGVAIQDLKHPVVEKESCRLVGNGAMLKTFRLTAHVLYRHTDKPENDIGLSCPVEGNVFLNDEIILPLRPGHSVLLTTKRYHYFGTRYFLELPIVNPEETRPRDPHSS